MCQSYDVGVTRCVGVMTLSYDVVVCVFETKEVTTFGDEVNPG